MKNRVIALLFTLFTTFIYAQGEEVDLIVKRASKPFVENASFIVNFSIQTFTGSEKGVIYVSGDKYRIITDEFLMIYDGSKRYNYIEKNNEVYIEDQTHSTNIMETPQRLLKLSENSTPRLEVNNNKTKTLFYEKEKLIVNIDTSGDISSVEVPLDDNNNMVISLKNVDIKSNIDDSIFIFDTSKYENIEVIDLR